MITTNITVGDESTTRFSLGRRLENEATEIVFDISYFIENFGEGTATLLAKRSQDTSAYPVSVTQEDTSVTWLVSNADTAYKGQGSAELFWYVGDVLAKSVVYSTWTDNDIGEEGEVPEAQESWVEALIEEVTAAKEAAIAAQEAAEAAQAAVEQMLTSMVYLGSDGKLYVND